MITKNIASQHNLALDTAKMCCDRLKDTQKVWNFRLTTRRFCDSKKVDVLGFMLSAKTQIYLSKITISESRLGGLRGTVISVILTTTWWSSSDPPILEYVTPRSWLQLSQSLPGHCSFDL